MRSSKKYNRVCSATFDEKIASEKYTAPWVNKAVLEIIPAVNVPYLDVRKVLGKSEDSEIIISPFTRVNKVEKSKDNAEKYIVSISKVELEKEPSREEKVYKETEEANNALKELFAIKNDIEKMYIRKDELLSNAKDTKKADTKRTINEEVRSLEKDIEAKTNEANKLEVKYSSWKRELNSLIRTNLSEVEVELEKCFAKQLEDKKLKILEDANKRKEEEEKQIKELIDTSAEKGNAQR